jgi:hypothetical protein
MKKLTTEEFIKKAKKIHGDDKYDYSKTEYKNAKTVVIIICNIFGHGEFIITPNNHISGKQGCCKCGHGMYIFSTKDFIENSKKIHGDKYDYSKSIYKKMNSLLIITCLLIGHGDFEQTPSNHITHKQGCSLCANNYKSNTIEFIEKSILVHGIDKYDYSNVHYVNRESCVEIICTTHGTFQQTPGNHLCGYGCNKCGIIQMKISQKKTLEEFINEANIVHNNKYDYSDVNYENARTKITIICPKHGPFSQTPDSHLRECGCPNCFSKHSKAQIEYLNFMASLKKINIRHAENGGEYKIPNTIYSADGYNDKFNTIYEYHGDFWHGNPKIYNKMDLNPITKTTFGKLYENTIQREEKIKNYEYKLIVIWDSEWRKFKKSVIKLQLMFRKNHNFTPLDI